jgi:hypothetical protein
MVRNEEFSEESSSEEEEEVKRGPYQRRKKSNCNEIRLEGTSEEKSKVRVDESSLNIP